MKLFSELNKGDKIYIYNKLTKDIRIATIENVSKPQKQKGQITIMFDADGDIGVLEMVDNTDRTSATVQNIIFSTIPIQ